MQLLALVELQLKVEDPPLPTAVGFADKVTVGAGDTVSVALLLPDPPLPLQVSV